MRRSVPVLAALALALFCLGPLVWQGVTSVKPTEELTRIPPLLPSSVTWDHYRAVLWERPFLRILANSAAVAGGATLLCLLLAAPAAFALAKLRVRGAGLVLLGILSVSLLPPIATVSPLYLVVRGLGLRDTLAALILVDAAFSLPLAVWVLHHFFDGVPHELYLAARADGCRAAAVFLRIYLPLAAPGLWATAILVFVYAWNEFLFALTFSATTASRTVPVAVALFPGIHEVPWGEISAASVAVTVPVLLLVPAFARRIQAGLTAGAVKE